MWLADRGVEATVAGPTTIASLYALADDSGAQPKPSVGFGD